MFKRKIKHSVQLKNEILVLSYDCRDCGGIGLIGNNDSICQNCGGKGLELTENGAQILALVKEFFKESENE